MANPPLHDLLNALRASPDNQVLQGLVFDAAIADSAVAALREALELCGERLSLDGDRREGDSLDALSPNNRSAAANGF